jgi:cyclic pyranopterin monophosphate synthase
MVDVGKKPVRARVAVARACVRFPAGIMHAALAGGAGKGPVLELARVAGILAAKRTDQLIPLCHSLGLDDVDVEFRELDPERLEVRCRAACRGRTGVEMEAMLGAALAALAVYDMSKALDHGIVVEQLELLEKRGGKSGIWKRRAEPTRGSKR